MMNLLKRLKTVNIFFAAILLFFFSSCKKEVNNAKYIAKVNNSYLTEGELDSIYNSSSGSRYRNEIIRSWINRELLFQEAQKKGLLNNTKYKQVLDDSKKELAASFLMKDFFEKTNVSADRSELEKYYNDNKDEFKLIYKSYLVNLITFSSEEKALKFRSLAIDNSWEEAVSEIHQDKSVTLNKSRDLLFDYEVQPVSLLRVVKELYPSEISIVVNNEEKGYTIIQLLENFDKGVVPPFDLIENEVKNSYLMKKRELTVKDYIKELYSKNDIEVKN